MKNIGLIMLLCFAVFMGCGSRKSHVVKSSLDSLVESREVNNTSIKAGSWRSQNTSLKMDSSWVNAVRLVNFTGVIFPDGKVDGKADEAEVLQQGAVEKEADQTLNEKDSTSLDGSSEVDSKTKVGKRNTVADKETKGIAVPWYMWLVGLAAVVCLIYIVYNRIKQKLKPF